MTDKINNDERYKIYAKNRDMKLVIKNLVTQTYFIKTAQEILHDAELLAGFTSQQISFINVVAELQTDNA